MILICIRYFILSSMAFPMPCCNRLTTNFPYSCHNSTPEIDFCSLIIFWFGILQLIIIIHCFQFFDKGIWYTIVWIQLLWSHILPCIFCRHCHDIHRILIPTSCMIQIPITLWWRCCQNILIQRPDILTIQFSKLITMGPIFIHFLISYGKLTFLVLFIYFQISTINNFNIMTNLGTAINTLPAWSCCFPIQPRISIRILLFIPIRVKWERRSWFSRCAHNRIFKVTILYIIIVVYSIYQWPIVFSIFTDTVIHTTTCITRNIKFLSTIIQYLHVISLLWYILPVVYAITASLPFIFNILGILHTQTTILFNSVYNGKAMCFCNVNFNFNFKFRIFLTKITYIVCCTINLTSNPCANRIFISQILNFILNSGCFLPTEF